MWNYDAKRGYQIAEKTAQLGEISRATEVECTAQVSNAWKKSLSSVILRNLTCLEIYVLGCRLEGRLGVPQEARGKVRGAILSPGARVTDMARL